MTRQDQSNDRAGRPSISIRGLAQDLLRTTRALRRAVPGAIAVMAIAAVVEALATIGLPFAAKQLIDAAGAARAEAGPLTWPLVWLGVEVGLAVGRVLAQQATRYGTTVLQSQGALMFSRLVLRKACNVAYPWFENTEFVNRLGRATEYATTQVTPFSLQAFAILRSALIFLGCLALLGTTSIWMLPILIIAALPAFAVDGWHALRTFELERVHIHRRRHGWYLEWLLTAEQTAKEIRSLAAGRWLGKLYERTHAPFCHEQTALAGKLFRYGMVPALIGVLSLYGPYLYIVLRTIRGEGSVGEMLLFILAFQQGSAALSQLLGVIARAFQQQLYVRTVLEVLDHPEEDPEQEPAIENVVPEAPELVLEDVWFTYPGSDTPVFRGLNLRIRAGETIALVGKNGIGKTTLVKLLVGLYPISRGRILLGGVDLATRSPAWRRDNLGVVFQDFARFHFSALWNVGLGWHPDADDRARVAEAIERADAAGIIAGLSRGIESALGTAFGGRDISGGQWQRLALARLFMRRSRLWILDEPTSAMDPDAEERTFRRFRDWSRGRTAIIIAHRFATIRIADRIAVIDEGRVTELGTHDELVAAGGGYARMYGPRAQAYATKDAEDRCSSPS